MESLVIHQWLKFPQVWITVIFMVPVTFCCSSIFHSGVMFIFIWCNGKESNLLSCGYQPQAFTSYATVAPKWWPRVESNHLYLFFRQALYR